MYWGTSTKILCNKTTVLYKFYLMISFLPKLISSYDDKFIS